MDKGMKSALCETGRIPGRVDRNIEAGTAVYFPGGGATEAEENVIILTLNYRNYAH